MRLLKCVLVIFAVWLLLKVISGSYQPIDLVFVLSLLPSNNHGIMYNVSAIVAIIIFFKGIMGINKRKGKNNIKEQHYGRLRK